MKKTTDISEALTAGTWTEVTDRVASIDSTHTQIEKDLGQFTADGLTVTGLGRDWWKSNIFNATASQYIEFKIEVKIGTSSSNLASDTCYAFSGFVDKREYRPNETEDMVVFNVFSPDELGNRLAGENIAVQYIDDDIDGSGTDGLILFEIPNLFVKDANIASFILHAGVHVITYDYNGGSRRAKLDDGDYVSLSANNTNYTLVNGDGDQKLQVRVQTLAGLPQTQVAEDIVVTTAGDTLPKQWYRGNNVRQLLTDIFNKIGITSTTFDTLELNTNDSVARISFLDIPPLSGAITGHKYAMVSDGTDLWLTVGNKLYKRTMSTHSYTLKATLTAGDNVEKMIHNAANSHIWMYVVTSAGAKELRRFTTSTDTLSAAVSIPNSDRYSFQICPSLYGILYCNSSTNDLMHVDGSTLSVTTAFTAAALGYTSPDGPTQGMSYVRGNRNGFTATVIATANYLHEVEYVLGVWTDHGTTSAGIPDGVHTVASYDSDEDRVYYWDSVNFLVRYHNRTATSGTTILTLGSSDTVHEMTFMNSKTYFTVAPNTSWTNAGKLYSAEAGAATLLSSSPSIYTKYFTFNFLSSRVYGIDYAGRLFQYDNTLAMYVPEADFEGMTIKEALNKTLQGFNLIANVSPAKRAFIFRRGNDAGAAQTTGNSITVTTAEAETLERTKAHQPAFNYIKITNGVTTYSYDGTDFNAVVLSDSRKLEVTNELIPDEIVKDVCYYMYQFWKTERDMLTIELPLVSLFQYEPCDGATISGFDEVSSATGLIMGATYHRDGSMTLEILTPLS